MDNVEDFFKTEFPSEFAAELTELWREFSTADLADSHFVSEIVSGDRNKLFQRIWEMQLAKHLRRLGYTLTSKDAGPDFVFTVDGRRVWIEAITPSPAGLPEDWLNPPARGEVRARQVPHEQILLRWTAALKEKRQKLEGYDDLGADGSPVKHVQGYREKGIVPDTDCYVIAINSYLLNLFPDLNGISRLPYPVEAAFAIGPLAMSIDQKTARTTGMFRVPRYSIKNQNGSDVRTDTFLDPSYSGVSAIVGCAACNPSGNYELVVVHNPLAINPVPIGIFGATAEYVPVPQGDDEYLIKRVPE